MRVLASAASIVAADGTADVAVGPPPVGQAWTIEILSVFLSTGNGTASVYSGHNPTDAAFLDGTYSGGRDSTARIGTLAQGEGLLIRWTGATPGARATATLRGTIADDRR